MTHINVLRALDALGCALVHLVPTMPIPQRFRRSLGFALGKAPFVVQKQVLETVLQRVFQSPIAQGDMDFLADRSIKICVIDFALSWVFGFEAERLVLYSPMQIADVIIAADAAVFVQLATGQQDPDTLFFQRKMSIEGDTELGLAVKNVMDSIGALQLPQPVQQLLHKII